MKRALSKWVAWSAAAFLFSPDLPSKEIPPAPALAPELRRELGSASFVPEDAAFFSASYRLKERFERLKGSNAVRKILALPVVKGLLDRTRSSPGYLNFQEQLNENPAFAALAKNAADAVSREVFVYGGREWVPFLQALSSIYGEFQVESFRAAIGKREPSVAGLVSLFLRHRESLRLPPLTLGFRLTDSAELERMLASFLKEAGPDLPFPVEEKPLPGGGKRYSMVATGRAIPESVREEWSQGMAREGVPEDQIGRVNQWLDGVSASLTVAFRNNYLLVSLAENPAHLERLGAGKPLAESAAFAPVRNAYRPGLASISYLHPQLATPSRFPEEETLAAADELLGGIDPAVVKPQTRARLKRDLRSLLGEMNADVPPPSARASCSFWTAGGVESFSFTGAEKAGKAKPGPLSIRAHCGASPLFSAAYRCEEMKPALEQLARWSRVAYGYFEEIALPRIPPAERTYVDRFRKIVVPWLGRMHKATMEDLLPAVDGLQGMWVLDGNGKLATLPRGDASVRLAEPFDFPRLAWVIEIRDAVKLARAFATYRDEINGLIRALSAAEGKADPPFQIPAPDAAPDGKGTVFSYPIPSDLGPDVRPHARLTDRLLVVGSSPAHSRELVEGKGNAQAQPGEEVAVGAPSLDAATADLRGTSAFLCRNARKFLDVLMAQGAMDRDEGMFFATHLPVLQEALGTLRRWSRRTYVEGGLLVSHSLLKVEDLKTPEGKGDE